MLPFNDAVKAVCLPPAQQIFRGLHAVLNNRFVIFNAAYFKFVRRFKFQAQDCFALFFGQFFSQIGALVRQPFAETIPVCAISHGHVDIAVYTLIFKQLFVILIPSDLMPVAPGIAESLPQT